MNDVQNLDLLRPDIEENQITAIEFSAVASDPGFCPLVGSYGVPDRLICRS